MNLTIDPNDRPRVDPEAQRNRDAEVARLRRARVPFRTIAERLGMSLGAVQKAVQRNEKRVDALSSGELSAEDVTIAADLGRCNELHRYRLRHFAEGSPERVALADWSASLKYSGRDSGSN
jgi:hypothetical protein